MSDHFHNLSRRLYNILEHVGASEDMRSFHQTVGINTDINLTFGNYLEHRQISQFIFGSFCEGTTTPGLNSDIDMLYCDNGYPVTENSRDAAGYGLSFLMVRDNHTQPGYVKLQEVHNGIPQNVYSMDINNCVDSDCNGKMCLKHSSYCGKQKYINKRSGPADTMIYGSTSTDIVLAYRCSTVPSFTSEWIGQPRPYNWPSTQIIDQLKSSGCFVVGVGHPESREKLLEWRLSFSLQERQLMLNFNPVQHKCYILLKMIKNDLITRHFGKSVSSYHCKTCMFHVIENTRACIWKPENLFSCVRLCLCVLRSYVINGICPNYFIKEENMFDRDVHRNIKPRLIELLTQMISEEHTLLLQIRCDQIGDIFMGTANVYQISQANITHSKKCKRYMITFQAYLRNVINRLLKGSNLVSNCCWLSTFIRDLTSCMFFKDHDDQQTREALRHMIPFVHSRLAQQCVSLAVSDGVRGTPLMPHLLHASYYHFREGSSCDVTSSRLVYASVLYTFGQYDSCLSLLDQINADLKPDVETVCSGHIADSYKDITDENMPSFLASTASCVMFLPSDLAIVPSPLQCEVYRSVNTPPGSRDEEDDYWYDCAVIDGKVYIHVLNYLVNSKLNKIIHKKLAISNLRCVLENDRYLGHRETGYNLLGWIYVQENRIEEGVWCFCESWKIKPHHNAAKWHLGITVYNQIRSGQ